MPEKRTKSKSTARSTFTEAEFVQHMTGNPRAFRAVEKPAIITHRGKPAVVVLRASEYERLAGEASLARSLGRVAKSLKEFQRGLGVPLDEAFEQAHDRILRNKRERRRSVA
jgi:PHD/YefM family antitoxin component YafN of YafNO toxin-antitoxin module